MDWNIVWAIWFALFALFEGVALADRRRGDTLSERTREWFKTENSVAGRRIFASVWTTFCAWFLWHILWQ